VHVDGAEVKVLGTEFNVRGWSEDPVTEVIVRKGKVAVNSSAQEIDGQSEVILTEGYYTRVERGKAPAPAQRVDPINYLLWTSGGMHFDNEPLAQVIRNIERRFDVEITVVGEELKDVPYTGTFQYADLDEVLSVIGASVGFEYSRLGRAIEFVYDANIQIGR
jgi:transmembrane sensor